MEGTEERLAAIEKSEADLETIVQGQQTAENQDWAEIAEKFADALRNPAKFFNRENPEATRDTSAEG